MHFLCDHSYHSHCFSSFADNDSECPACLNDNKKILDIGKICHEVYLKIHYTCMMMQNRSFTSIPHDQLYGNKDKTASKASLYDKENLAYLHTCSGEKLSQGNGYYNKQFCLLLCISNTVHGPS